MEKLIKLINKRQEETHPDGIYLPVVAYRDGIFWSDSDCLSSVMDEIYLVSKPCGFIGWLVENDKINGNKYDEWLDKEGVDMEYPALEKLPHKEAISMVMIMLLSIQDKPIDLLCNLLK